MSDVAEKDLAHWKLLALQTGERLRIATEKLEATKTAADDARARVTKYKNRLDAAQAQVDRLNTSLIAVSAERDAVREQLKTERAAFESQLAKQEIVKRKIYEFRQSILDGPIWEVFAEFCRDVGAQPADEGVKA